MRSARAKHARKGRAPLRCARVHRSGMTLRMARCKTGRRATGPLDLGDGLKRLRIDEDQLFLEPDRLYGRARGALPIARRHVAGPPPGQRAAPGARNAPSEREPLAGAPRRTQRRARRPRHRQARVATGIGRLLDSLDSHACELGCAEELEQASVLLVHGGGADEQTAITGERGVAGNGPRRQAFDQGGGCGRCRAGRDHDCRLRRRPRRSARHLSGSPGRTSQAASPACQRNSHWLFTCSSAGSTDPRLPKSAAILSTVFRELSTFRLRSAPPSSSSSPTRPSPVFATTSRRSGAPRSRSSRWPTTMSAERRSWPGPPGSSPCSRPWPLARTPTLVCSSTAVEQGSSRHVRPSPRAL